MRKAEIKRKTSETEINIKINLDGNGDYKIKTPYGFMTHMLELLSKHSGIDMSITAKGDTDVDPHHTIEDIGIGLGEAINKALGERAGIERFGWVMMPMDEVRCDVSVDLSGRSNLVYEVKFSPAWGNDDDFDYSLIKEFMKSLSENLKATIHVILAMGDNNHHIAESVFKGLARALRQAVKISSDDIPSTKGVL